MDVAIEGPFFFFTKKLAFKNKKQGACRCSRCAKRNECSSYKVQGEASGCNKSRAVALWKTKELWDSVRKMTNMTSTEKGIVTSNDPDKTNALNDFFLRFDLSPALLLHLGWLNPQIIYALPLTVGKLTALS